MKTLDKWTLTTIEQCCEILDSKRIPINTEDRKKRIGDIPYYGANGLQGYIDDFIFNEPLILIAEDGGRFDEYATHPIAYRINGKSWVNNHAHVLRAKRGFCQDAIFYNLEHKDIRSFIVGGTRTKLNQSALRKIKIFLPTSKLEQAKIAEILSTIDFTIEQTEALIAKQQRIKTGLIQDLLTRGIDEHGNLRSEQTHKFKDSQLGRIPVEWDVKRWRQVCKKIQDGTHFSPQTDSTAEFKYITSKNIKFGFMDLKEIEYINRAQHDEIYKHCDVQQGDVLLTKDGVNTGNAAINPLREEFSLLSSVVFIRPMKNMLLSEFLLQSILSESGQRLIKDAMSGLAITRITLSIINDFLLKIPPIQEQQCIGQILSKQDSLIKFRN